MSTQAPIILAVDTQDVETAARWVSATHDYVSVYKLGLEFFLRHGHAGYKAISDNSDAQIFLDLKLHDIPNTVASAVNAVKELSPRFLTVHASGGSAMISAAADAAGSIDITAVTILTSLSEQDLFEIGYSNNAVESATSLAVLATRAGARAIVSSPLEITSIRASVGSDPIIITPGVRPASSTASDDQVRTMTPEAAISAGANYVVIGRPITQQWVNGADAMTLVARSIAESIHAI